MASSGFDSGRQFEIDPVSGQIFYREPIEGFYTSWTPLEPSDYHPPRPAGHNVSGLLQIYLLCTNLHFSHRYSPPTCTNPLQVLKGSLAIYQHKFLLVFRNGRVTKPLIDPHVLTILSAVNKPNRRRGERVKGELVGLPTTAPERSKFSSITLRPNSLLAQKGGT